MAGQEINNSGYMPDPTELDNEQDMDHESSEPIVSNTNFICSNDTSSDSDSSSDSVTCKWQQKAQKCLKNLPNEMVSIDGKPRSKRRWRYSMHHSKKRDPVDTEQRIEDITRRLRELEERSIRITMLKFRIDYLIAQHMQRQAEDDSNPDEE